MINGQVLRHRLRLPLLYCLGDVCVRPVFGDGPLWKCLGRSLLRLHQVSCLCVWVHDVHVYLRSMHTQ